MEMRKSGRSTAPTSKNSGEESWSRQPSGHASHVGYPMSASATKTMFAVYADSLPPNVPAGQIHEFFRSKGADDVATHVTLSNGKCGPRDLKESNLIARVDRDDVFSGVGTLFLVPREEVPCFLVLTFVDCSAS
jgi:hypothetical protein